MRFSFFVLASLFCCLSFCMESSTDTLRNSIKDGDEQAVERYLESDSFYDGVIKGSGYMIPLSLASQYDQAAIVWMLLLKLGDDVHIEPVLKDKMLETGFEVAINSASEFGQDALLQHLLTIYPGRTYFRALVLAIAKGRWSAVSILLENDMANQYLVAASGQGKLEVVQYLLDDPRVDPSAQESESLWVASELDCANVVELLLKDGRASLRRNGTFIDVSQSPNVGALFSDEAGCFLGLCEAASDGNALLLTQENLSYMSERQLDILVARARRHPESVKVIREEQVKKLGVGEPFISNRYFMAWLEGLGPVSMAELRSAATKYATLRRVRMRGFEIPESMPALPEIMTTIAKFL